jgi:hypothetical protein
MVLFLARDASSGCPRRLRICRPCALAPSCQLSNPKGKQQHIRESKTHQDHVKRGCFVGYAVQMRRTNVQFRSTTFVRPFSCERKWAHARMFGRGKRTFERLPRKSNFATILKTYINVQIRRGVVENRSSPFS